MSVRKIVFVAMLFAAAATSFDTAQAKREPGPESIVPDQYAVPTGYQGAPLADRIDPDGRARRLYNPNFVSRFTEPEQIAANYLEQMGSSLGLKGDDLSLISSKSSLAGRHFRYQQVWRGIPVFARQVLVNIRNDSAITSVVSDFVPIADAPTQPSLTAAQAIAAAEAAVGVSRSDGEPSAELVIYADRDTPALCWLVSFVTDKPLGDWQVFVDAITGQVIDKKNIMCFEDGSGYVFNPNPVVSEGNINLRDSTDRNYPALTNARRDVILRDLAPPSGGLYYLTGPYVSTSPTANRARAADPDSFHYNRQDDRFEETVVYYQIDSCERFYQALGFSNIMNYPITINVNGTTDDNSWYTPSQHRITYGSGGVDDAEDGDVIIHEYGHATQFDQVPNWGQTHEGGSMGEGFGDYLTVSFFHPVFNNWDEARVFDWDANPRDGFWLGRRVDTNRHYPEDMHGEVHDDGEIWSRCLWDIQNDIGHDTTLQIVLEAHFALTSQANFIDAANAIVDADIDLYGGRHLLAIGQAFLDRGIFTELPIELNIVHQPLYDTENFTQPFAITAVVEHTFPIDSMRVYYRFPPDLNYIMLNMNPTGNPEQYSAAIPAPGHASQVEYYLRVVDSLGLAAALPLDAPTHTFLFYAGPDTILPVITHTPLMDLPAVIWPPTISATITDNLGVDSAWVIFQVNGQEPVSVPLAEVDTVNTWQGQLTGTVAIGDTVRYRIKAKDISNGGNIAYLPPMTQPRIEFVILGINAYTYVRSGFPIADYPAPARIDTFTISEYFEIFEADVFVDIDHADISDLYFYIQSPQGTRVVLHNRTGSGDSLVGWYDDDLAPDGPGNMGQLVGQQAHGRWTFFISDRVTGNTGVVNGWVLRLAFPGSVGVAESDEAIPRPFALESNYPNPFNPSTVINFSLPAQQHVRLEVFDLLGRVVRTLVDSDLPAGRHQVEWDGRASSGERASSGVYFARLSSGGEQAVIRMSLVK